MLNTDKGSPVAAESIGASRDDRPLKFLLGRKRGDLA
jgi:hypothetical protein